MSSKNAGGRTPVGAPGSTSTAPSLPGTSNISSGGRNRTKNTVLTGLKDSLKTLGQCTNLVPSLKPVVGGLIDIDVIPESNKRHKEYEQLASNITLVVQGLERQLRQLSPEQVLESVTSVVEELKKQVEHITKQQNRQRLSRYANAELDIDDILERYRRIQALFQYLQNDIVLSLWRSTDDSLLAANEHMMRARLVELNPAKQARYNSSAAAQVRRRGCTVNTRELVLTGLRDWAGDPNGAKVYWMNGMAGTGKTTIAYSLCASLKASNQLAANFFCSRALPDCQDVTRIVPTIAYQLAQFSRDFQMTLYRTLGNDPDISTCDIATQFENLLSGPLTKVESTMPPGLFVVVVDALDECTDRSEAQTLLNILLRSVSRLPVKFFITCRPEPYLLDKVAAHGNLSSSIFHLHNIEESLVRADIETYLTIELECVRVSLSDIKRLAELSGKLFIHAATAVRYIRSDTTPVSHHNRLKTVLSANIFTKTKAHGAIDALYGAIISSAMDNEELEDSEVGTIKLVLHTIVCAREPVTMNTLATLLRMENASAVQVAIQPLQSVIHVSKDTKLVSTFHASFPDYILSQQRAGRFFCNIEEHHKLLTSCCFGVMQELPRFNIRDLLLPFGSQDQVSDLITQLGHTVSASLLYACHYWGAHLIRAGSLNLHSLEKELSHFLETQTLFWMEVMNIKKRLNACPRIISEAHQWLRTCRASPSLREAIQGLQNYVALVAVSATPETSFQTKIALLMSRSSAQRQCALGRLPHTYVSLLSCWRVGGPVWNLNKRQVSLSQSSLETLAVGRAHGPITSMALSSDGLCVAYSCDDGTICVWNAYTADVIVGPFKAHTGSIRSVAFSPDSSCIASGSDDCTIRLWDAYTGDTVAASFEGDIGVVGSIAFSPDGGCIASGSSNCTVQIWDAHTGYSKARPFRGHTAMINSVAFSPDGNRIASGSSDFTIRIWDAQTGDTIAGPFKGHKSMVNGIGFSPDGKHVASGSRDRTIRLWDSYTGRAIRTLEGHTDVVSSVGFSPDGDHLVSASHDHSIRIWDARTGQRVGYIQERTGAVVSVALSAGGDRIVSGSSHHIIHIWGVCAQQTRDPSEEQEEQICCVAFSPAGDRIASGSSNGTVCLWNAHTSRLLQSGDCLAAKNGYSAISCIAFSLDGTHVAFSAGSYVFVKDIRIWGGPSWRFTQAVTSIALSPDCKHLAIGSHSGATYTLDISSTEAAKAGAGLIVADPSYQKSTTFIGAVAFSPCGDYVASITDMGVICVWDMRNRRMISGSIMTRARLPDSIAFLPEGGYIITSSNANVIQIWRVYDRTLIIKKYPNSSPTDINYWVASYDLQILTRIPLDLRTEFERQGISFPYAETATARERRSKIPLIVDDWRNFFMTRAPQTNLNSAYGQEDETLKQVLGYIQALLSHRDGGEDFDEIFDESEVNESDGDSDTTILADGPRSLCDNPD
ncbi:hypothetical protein FRC09_019854 [Ceratobasidium sp. 395]|nr:hypothetical protein FRC09_019854 [Ceratobasidium sp. 395]